MTTRGGTSYQPMTDPYDEIQSSRSDQMMDMLQSLLASQQDMRASLLNLTNRMNQLEHNPGHPRVNLEVTPIPTQQAYVHRDSHPDDRVLRNVRLDAPAFDGSLDPIKFLDWLTELEDYFEWHQMGDDRRVGLARMKL